MMRRLSVVSSKGITVLNSNENAVSDVEVVSPEDDSSEF